MQARYKIVRRYSTQAQQPMYVIKERTLYFFWSDLYTFAEFASRADAESELRLILDERHRAADMKSAENKNKVTFRYDKFGDRCK